MTVVSDLIRDQVRLRAHDHCEYCGKSPAASFHGFHVDHIIPPQHGGDSSLDNLAWACFECNVSKGRDIASYDFDTRILTPLFNPRRQHWMDHFSWNGAVITPKTAVGRVTVRLLDLNHPAQVEIRQQLMNAGLWDTR